VHSNREITQLTETETHSQLPNHNKQQRTVTWHSDARGAQFWESSAGLSDTFSFFVVVVFLTTIKLTKLRQYQQMI